MTKVLGFASDRDGARCFGGDAVGKGLRIERVLPDTACVDTVELRNGRGYALAFGGRPAATEDVVKWAECAMDAASADDPVARLSVGPRVLHSVVAWSVERQRLLLVSGRSGLFPIYLIETADGLWFSSHAGLLVGKVTIMPNPAGLAQLLCFGHCFGRTTATRSLAILEPGEVVSRERHRGLAWLGRFVGPTTPRLKKIHRQSLYAAITERLTKVVQDCVAGNNAWLQASGGLDSRLLIASAGESGAPLMTFGSPESTDVRIAAELARATGRPFVQFDTTISEQALDGWADRVVWCSGGEKPLNHAHTALPYEAYGEASSRVLINGNGGEYARAYWYDLGPLGHLFRAKPSDGLLNSAVVSYLKRRLAGRNGLGLLALIRPEVRANLEETPIDALRQSFQSFAGGLSLGALMDDHYLEVRNHRFVMLGLQLGGMFFKRAHPFFDPTLHDLMAQVPLGDRLGSRFHRQTIAALSPALMKIEWDKTGCALEAGATPFGWIPMPWRPFRQRRVHEVIPYVDYANLFRTRWKCWFADTAATVAPNLDAWIPAHETLRLRDEHLAGYADHTRSLGVLLSFGLWARRLPQAGN